MVLVVGATGELGMRIVRALRSSGTDVRALIRPGSHYYLLNDTGCSYFFGDLKDPVCLRRACRGVEQIICCAGIRVENRRDNHQSVTVDGHANLWAAAADAGVRRVLFVSAFGSDREYAVPWFHAKRQAELGLVESGLRYIILRPAPFTSNYVRWARMGRRNRVIMLPGSGDSLVSPISSDEVSAYAIACLNPSIKDNRCLSLGGSETLSGVDSVQLASQITGVNARIVFAGRRASLAAERVVQLAGHRWRHHLKLVRTWFDDDFSVKMEELRSEFGIESRSLKACFEADLRHLIRMEDPNIGSEGITYRRFNATIYSPGSSHLSELPTGPKRYDA